jgi:hypothetical protein
MAIIDGIVAGGITDMVTVIRNMTGTGDRLNISMLLIEANAGSGPRMVESTEYINKKILSGGACRYYRIDKGAWI